MLPRNWEAVWHCEHRNGEASQATEIRPVATAGETEGKNIGEG